jgi:hypothetical protein
MDITDAFICMTSEGIMLREIGNGIVAGALGTLALDVASYVDMAARARPASQVPAKMADILAQRAGVALVEEGERERNRLARGHRAPHDLWHRDCSRVRGARRVAKAHLFVALARGGLYPLRFDEQSVGGVRARIPAARGDGERVG